MVGGTSARASGFFLTVSTGVIPYPADPVAFRVGEQSIRLSRHGRHIARAMSGDLDASQNESREIEGNNEE